MAAWSSCASCVCPRVRSCVTCRCPRTVPISSSPRTPLRTWRLRAPGGWSLLQWPQALLSLLVGRRRNAACQLALLFRRELLIFLPLLLRVLALLRRKLLEALVLLSRRLALGRRQRGPGMHLLLDPLLLLGSELGVALGDADPFLLPVGVERVPVGGEWREDLLVGGRQF